MKKLFLLALALSVSAWASDDSLVTRVNQVQSQMDRIMSKAGIHFSGEFRGQYLNSQVSGSQVDSSLRQGESVEFTSVDFDIQARPNSALNARAIFRMHQDWRIFFSDLSTPIVTRWLSIDGEVGSGLFNYHLGDFKKKISPLTIWSPEVDLLMEPEIFARRRRLAMAEDFLGDNNRVLQGLDLSFAAEIYPILKQLDLGFYATRLRTATVAGTGHQLSTESADFDKYLWGFNGGVEVIPGLSVGGTYLNIFDNIETYKGAREQAELNAQNNTVFSGRLNVNNKSLMPSDMLSFGVNAEAAMSSDKIPYVDAEANEIADSSVSDMALYADLSAGLSLGKAHSVDLSLGFLNNGADFRNDAAQSPSYIPQRIMNTENTLPVHSFDAMYRNVFWFTASGDNHLERRPYRKLSYTRAILEREEYADGMIVDGTDTLGLDPVFQSALPFGLATPDRSGPVVNLKGSFLNKGINVAAKVVSLSDAEEKVNALDSTATYKNKYMEAGGGASIDVSKFLGILEKPLVLGAAYSMYNSTIAEDFDFKNNLLSANLEWNFYKNYSLLFGYQQLKSEQPEMMGFQITDTYTNLAAGLRLEVVEGGIVDIALTQVSGKSEGYVDEEGNAIDVDFKAFQPEVLLTVQF